MFTTNRFFRSSIAVMLVMFAGCKADPAPSAGFADPKAMKPDPTVPFNRFWRKPGLDLNQYDTLYVAEVNTSYMLQMTAWQKGERQGDIEKDVHDLAVYARNAVIKAFREDAKHRYKVVDQPIHNSHTLELEIALIEVVPSKVVLNVLGYAPFYIGTGITVVRTIANDKSTAAFEGRLRDGGSGEIVMLAADREAEQLAPVNLRGLMWYSDIEGIIDEWSKEFVLVANKRKDETVAGSPTFRLLPW